MSMEAASTTRPLSRFEQLRVGRDVIRQEAEALIQLASRLHDEFCDALEVIRNGQGNVVVTGMGKAGLIGQKIAATLASTGTKAQFLHAAEAVHGDLGRVTREDVVLAISFSGETEEVTRLIPSLATIGCSTIAITGRPASTLGKHADVVLDLGPLREACPLGLAPSTSTTAMLALGDALALVLSRMRGLRAEQFARFHPGGSLGRKLAKVEEVMRPLSDCRVASETRTIREVFVDAGRPGRRSGAIMLTDARGALSGLFTDSDLARLLERKHDAALDEPIANHMTHSPTTIARGAYMRQAIEVLAGRRISELPVVNDQGEPVGLIDITDVVATESSSEPAMPALPSHLPDESFPTMLPFFEPRQG